MRSLPAAHPERGLAYCWIRVEDAHLCLSCECIFSWLTLAKLRACPACGGETNVPLVKFLGVVK